MRFGPSAEPRPNQKIIVALILAMFAALLIVPGLDHRFGFRVTTTTAVPSPIDGSRSSGSAAAISGPVIRPMNYQHRDTDEGPVIGFAAKLDFH